MSGRVGRMTGWRSHSARVSVSRMRESLELHSLARIHFLAEAKQMERGVRADFILHA